MTIRRLVVVATLIATLVGCQSSTPSPAYWPTTSWRTSTPEAQGFDSAKLAAGLLEVRAKNLPIHSLLLVRNGSLLLDASFYPYDGSTFHDLASVTKTVTASLVGIAVGQGKLKMDDRMVSFFPERTIANRDARKERITVRQLVTMSSGLDCQTDNDTETVSDLMASPDWVGFALDRRTVAEPGSQFSYCSPGFHILSAILRKATGMSAADYARESLFKPLGITESRWLADPQGYTRGWGDLSLFPQDAAKLAYLWASGGVWDNKAVVPKSWVEDSVKVQIKTGQSDDYGYGWWVPSNSKTGEYAAIGRGGQRVSFHRALNLVVVLTGEGIQPDDALSLLAPALSGDKPLPTNPGAVAQLTAALDQLRAAPAAAGLADAPAMAAAVSGMRWILGPNAIQMKSVRLQFASGSDAAIDMNFADERPTIAGAIGLDGRYRLGRGADGLAYGFRGQWMGENSFLLEYNEIANNDVYELRFTFAADRLTLSLRERSDSAPLTLSAVPELPK